jgi:DNA-binding transcriptional ArsR family regulator
MGTQQLRSQTREAESESTLSKDTIFSMLSNQRRRHVLHYLKRNEGPATIRDLAEQLAAWENGVAVQELTYKQRKRVYTSLHQTHLPKLDDCGVVEYNRDRGVITLTGRVSELDVYLEVVPKNDIPWSDYYLGLAGVALALVVAAWLNVAPFTLLPDIAYGAVVAVVLGISAAFHTMNSRRTLLGGTERPVDASPPSTGAAGADDD